MAVDDPAAASAETLHQQFDAAWELLHTFFDWRHKVLVRFVVAVSAVLLAYANAGTRQAWIQPGLLGIGAAISALAALLDNVNQDLINHSYQHGILIERKLKVARLNPDGAAERGTDFVGGMFTTLKARSRNNPPWRTYHSLLKAVYSGSAAAFFGAAIVESFASY